MPRHELDAIVGRIAMHYFDLRDRAREAGTQGIVIDLPPELPIDRIGALDGVHTYPIDTPFEFRSLPRLRCAQRMTFTSSLLPPMSECGPRSRRRGSGALAAASVLRCNSRRLDCETWWSQAGCNASRSLRRPRPLPFVP
jgi:hypothetical protein